MEFLLEDLRIDQYGYPLARSLMEQGQYVSQSTDIQGLTVTEYHTATGGNKINKYDVLTSP